MNQTEERLKIIGLQIYGLRKIRAFKMAFAENGMTIISGKNGQGKTSVIDAIDILFRGVVALPHDAVSHGAEKLEIIGQLGDYTIRRIFNSKREQTTFQIRKGELTVSSKPQDFLNTFINEISANPMPFLNQKPEEKMKFLMKYAGIDFSTIDAKVATLESERTYIGREVKTFGEIVLPEKVEAVSLSELNAEIDRIDIENDKIRKEYEARQREELEGIFEYNNKQRKRQELIDSVTKTIGSIEDQLSSIKASLERGSLEEPTSTSQDIIPLKDYEISVLEEKYAYLSELRRVALTHIDKFTKPEPQKDAITTVKEPEYLPKDEVRQKIANSEETNLKARKYEDALVELTKKEAKEAEYRQKTTDIEKLRADKKAMLLKASLPVEGLELREDGVYYNGTFSENWSGAESWIISVKLCMAKNPKLKSVFYDGGELLDSDNRKKINQWCIDNDIQFIITKIADEIGSDDDPNVFFIEEGEVVDNKAAIDSKEKAKAIFPDAKTPTKVNLPSKKDVGTTATVKEKTIQSETDFDKVSAAEQQIGETESPVETENNVVENPVEQPKVEAPKSIAINPDDLFGGGL